MVRSTEGEGDRSARSILRAARLQRADPITLTLVRYAPSTSPTSWARFPNRTVSSRSIWRTSSISHVR
jgi:hypothetical protein